MTILPKAIYRFNEIPIKLPLVFFTEWEKRFRICMETQKTLNSQSNLEKEKWSWRNQAPWLQTILQSYSHQNSMVLAIKQKYTSMEQDRKSRDKPTHLWSPNIWQRKKEYKMDKSLFNKWCWENWTATCEGMKLEQSLTAYIKINWIKDLNVRPDNINLLEENISRTLFAINCSNIFLDPSPRVMETKQK